jgi:hypothetical protein
LDLGFEVLLVGGLGRERGESGEGRGSLKEGLEGEAEKRYFACDVAQTPPERPASTAEAIEEEGKRSSHRENGEVKGYHFSVLALSLAHWYAGGLYHN